MARHSDHHSTRNLIKVNKTQLSVLKHGPSHLPRRWIGYCPFHWKLQCLEVQCAMMQEHRVLEISGKCRFQHCAVKPTGSKSPISRVYDFNESGNAISWSCPSVAGPGNCLRLEWSSQHFSSAVSLIPVLDVVAYGSSGGALDGGTERSAAFQRFLSGNIPTVISDEGDIGLRQIRRLEQSSMLEMNDADACRGSCDARQAMRWLTGREYEQKVFGRLTTWAKNLRTVSGTGLCHYKSHAHRISWWEAWAACASSLRLMIQPRSSSPSGVDFSKQATTEMLLCFP